jgi:hypothetical protein
MADFEYHMVQLRHANETLQDEDKHLGQSLVSHLNGIIHDTRSALMASTASTNDAEQINDLVRRLYDENQSIANHIEHLLEQSPCDEIHHDNNHIQKAISEIQLACEQNQRERECRLVEHEQYENNQKIIQRFIRTTDDLHDEALKKLRQHIQVVREQNQSLKQHNEQIDRLSQQLPKTLFLSNQ